MLIFNNMNAGAYRILNACDHAVVHRAFAMAAGRPIVMGCDRPECAEEMPACESEPAIDDARTSEWLGLDAVPDALADADADADAGADAEPDAGEDRSPSAPDDDRLPDQRTPSGRLIQPRPWRSRPPAKPKDVIADDAEPMSGDTNDTNDVSNGGLESDRETDTDADAGGGGATPPQNLALDAGPHAKKPHLPVTAADARERQLTDPAIDSFFRSIQQRLAAAKSDADTPARAPHTHHDRLATTRRPIDARAHAQTQAPHAAASNGDVPRISGWLRRLFGWYAQRYVGKHFHSIGVARDGYRPSAVELYGRPLVIFLNHPSWWDPMVAMYVAERFFATREHYAPMDAAALEKYAFFKKLGMFGIATDGAAGARRFLRTAEAILQRPQAVLWITPQGEFTDARERPVMFRPGLGHLAHRLAAWEESPLVMPMAVEYRVGLHRLPDIRLRFGAPVDPSSPAFDGARPADFSSLLAQRLESELDALAIQVCAGGASAFETIHSRDGGINPVFDLWRRIKGMLAGKPSEARIDHEAMANARAGTKGEHPDDRT